MIRQGCRHGAIRGKDEESQLAMTLEMQSERSEVQPPCFKPVITEPRTKVSFRRLNGHDRDHAVPSLIAANPPVPANEITNYDLLIAVMRARIDALEISLSTIDEIAGLPERYASKLLRSQSNRRIGMKSLGDLLEALCLKLVAVPDDEAFARNRSRLVKRDDAHYRSARLGHDNRPGKKFKKISGSITARMFGWPAR